MKTNEQVSTKSRTTIQHGSKARRPAGLRGKLVLRHLGMGDVWYWQLEYRGRRYNQTTGTGELRQAIRVAKEKESALFEDRLADFERGKVRREQPLARYEGVVAAYPGYGAMVSLAPRTVANNIASLKWLLSALGIVTSGEIVPLTVEKLLSAGAGVPGVSFVSRVRQARSLFTKDALSFYQDRRMGRIEQPFPQVARRVEGKGQMPKKRIPSSELRGAVIAGLAAHEDARVRMAFYLCYGLALRRREAVFAGPSWLVEQAGETMLLVCRRDGFVPKGIEGSVPVPEGLVGLLRGGEGECFLPGTLTERFEAVDRLLPAAMRALGWAGPKFAHELRAWRGSEYYTEQGAVEAQELLRHASITTTYRHYAEATRRRKALPINMKGGNYEQQEEK